MRRKGQQAAAIPGPHVGLEMLMQLWGAAPGGNKLSWRALALQENRAKLACHGLLYGWDSPHG